MIDKKRIIEIANMDPYEYADSKDDFKGIDRELAKTRHQCSTIYLMLDAWNEFDTVMSVIKTNADNADPCNPKINVRISDALEKDLESLLNFDLYVRFDRKTSDGLKWEMKIAEWEICNFLYGGNKWNHTLTTIRTWWDEHCYSINYDLCN